MNAQFLNSSATKRRLQKVRRWWLGDSHHTARYNTVAVVTPVKVTTTRRPWLCQVHCLSVRPSVRPTVGEVKILCPDVIVISDWHLFVSSSSSLNQLVDLPPLLLLPLHLTFSSSSSREHVLIIVVSDCCIAIFHLSLITWITFLGYSSSTGCGSFHVVFSIYI